MQYFLEMHENANCVYDKYIDDTILKSLHREAFIT